MKSDAYKAFEKFIADISPLGKVKRLRSDNGGEFISSNFNDVATKNNVRQEFSSPESPHQNGTAERGWRTLFEMAKCILNENNLPKFLWTYALRFATYVRNRYICWY